MNFRDEWLATIDQFSGMPPGGNPATEWGTAVQLDRTLYQHKPGWLQRLTIKPGLICKKLNADGSHNLDDVTHDDIKGVMAGTSKEDFLQVVDEMKCQSIGPFWFYSPTGKRNWASLVKPSDKAAYRLAAGYTIGLWATLWLALAFDLDKASPDTASDTRLMWLVSRAVGGKNERVNHARFRWQVRLNANGGIKAVFRRYHGDNHPFTRYSS